MDNSSMLQNFRERLALVLLGVLPLHALLVTIATKLIAGPGNAPLTALVLWKEALLGIILLVAAVEIVREKKWKVESGKSIDTIDIVILIAVLYAGFMFLGGIPHEAKSFVLGFKYDFVPLIAFLILRRVQWSAHFKKSAVNVILFIAALIGVYGILSVFLPMSFFVSLGYSDLHSLYVAEGPLAAFQQIGGTTLRRIQSTMSGPNQFGLYMLIPLALAMGEIVKPNAKKHHIGAILFLVLASIILSFSRAAWIGALIMIIFVALPIMIQPSKRAISAMVCGCMVCCGVALAVLFPSIFLRLASSEDHLRRPIEALQMIGENPIGLGLGKAGPASNATSDTCVTLEAGADASWAADRPDLCVFVAGEKVQPVDQECNCPVLTENWYLQWGVEMGMVGLVLSLLIPFFVLKKLRIENGEWRIGLAFIGLSIAGLFLHSFEDAAVAYSIWLLVAVSF